MKQLVVGFDLDMTLIDTVVGFAATLEALGAEVGVEFPIAEMTGKLGPPLDLLLEDHLPQTGIQGAVARFREIYPDTAVVPTPVFPGAHEAIEAVRRHHGRVLLVTGKHTPNAQLHVDHLGLDVDVVEGQVWGVGKADALTSHGATIYVGDHFHDVEGALAAGAISVSVLTGGCSREELEEAGTHVVLDDLTEFPAWLDEHLLTTRLSTLEQELRKHDRAMVALSGGADSAFLLAAAVRALGKENVTAATAYSPSLPGSEREPAQRFADDLGVRTITPTTDELARDGYRRNEGDRCAFCKSELIETLTLLADGAAVMTGTNADDAVAGFRPGIQAAADRGAVTPLRDAGLTKAQVREASRRWALPTWDKPAAACLSSRIAYGIEITPARLARVERAEAAVRDVLPGVRNVRVRDLGDRARVEVDEEHVDRARAIDALDGFDEFEVQPFRSGSMNELLEDPDKFR